MRNPVMNFSKPLISGTLIKRYKRFLADIQLASGEVITAHTANPGSMLGLTDAGNEVRLSHHPDSDRKLKYSWEMVRVQGIWVGINTSLPNRLVEAALRLRQIPELKNWREIRREVPYGKNSRIDLLLEIPQAPLCYVEIKNVTLAEKNIAYFPDAKTERGTKHLHEMQAMVKQGHRAVQFYLVQREDCREVRPADHIDKLYGQTLREARKNGVEILAYQAHVTPEKIEITDKLPVVI